MIRPALIVAAALGLAGSLLAQGPGPRRDGRWEVKVEASFAGQTMPAQTVTQCITPAQAADPKSAMPPQGRGGRGNDDCQMTDYKVEGTKVTFKMVCERQQINGTGEFNYAGDSYTGLMKMNAQGQDMSMKYTAKRLGDCTQ